MEDLQPGDPQQIGPYRLEGRLAAGGMGRVYLGRSPGGRRVAIKVIRAELAEDAEFRDRFTREVAAARKVSGIFTADVVDADAAAPVPWLATSYVAGPSLADAVAASGPLSPAALLELAAGLAEGLVAIHSAGVVHRDLKPSNVLLAEDGPRLIDFGIARAMEASALTQTGTVIGSPGFMSPEQAGGGDVGPPSDIFSLGAVLAFAATGQGPFGEGSGPSLLSRVVSSEPDTSQVPSEIRPVVDRCLAKDPLRRPTGAQLLAELTHAAGWRRLGGRPGHGLLMRGGVVRIVWPAAVAAMLLSVSGGPARFQPTARGVLDGKIVLVDPGHNGGNAAAPSVIDRLIWNGRESEACDTTGAQAASGYTEALFNWNVARYLTADLRAEGATVVITRNSNTGVGPCVTRRAATGNDARADAGVSIHADGGPPGGLGFAILEPVADGVNDAIIGPSAVLGADLRAAFAAGTGEPVSSYAGIDGIQPRDDLAEPIFPHPEGVHRVREHAQRHGRRAADLSPLAG